MLVQGSYELTPAKVINASRLIAQGEYVSQYGYIILTLPIVITNVLHCYTGFMN